MIHIECDHSTRGKAESMIGATIRVDVVVGRRVVTVSMRRFWLFIPAQVHENLGFFGSGWANTAICGGRWVSIFCIERWFIVEAVQWYLELPRTPNLLVLMFGKHWRTAFPKLAESKKG